MIVAHSLHHEKNLKICLIPFELLVIFNAYKISDERFIGGRDISSLNEGADNEHGPDFDDSLADPNFVPKLDTIVASKANNPRPTA